VCARGTSRAQCLGMNERIAGKPSDVAVRMADDLPFSAAEIQQLIDSCDGNIVRARFEAQTAAGIGWSIQHTIVMQRMMAARLACVAQDPGEVAADRKAS
jgi:hypothetical protein